MKRNCPHCGLAGSRDEDSRMITPGGNPTFSCINGHTWTAGPGQIPLAGVPLDDENTIG